MGPSTATSLALPVVWRAGRSHVGVDGTNQDSPSGLGWGGRGPTSGPHPWVTVPKETLTVLQEPAAGTIAVTGETWSRGHLRMTGLSPTGPWSRREAGTGVGQAPSAACS